jgi:hypothetical protein
MVRSGMVRISCFQFGVGSAKAWCGAVRSGTLGSGVVTLIISGPVWLGLLS